MTRAELIDAIAADHDLSRADAARAVSTIMGQIIAHLETGSRVDLRGFGSFRAKMYPAFRGHNPRTGAEVEVPVKRAVRFKASKVMLRRLNQAAETEYPQGLGAA